MREKVSDFVELICGQVAAVIMSTLDDFFAKKDRKKKGGKTGDGSRNERAETSGGKKEKTVDITNNFKYISDVGEQAGLDELCPCPDFFSRKSRIRIHRQGGVTSDD